MVIRARTVSIWIRIQSSCYILASTVQTLPDGFGWTFGKFICLLCRGVLKHGNQIKNEKSCGDRMLVKFVKSIDFLFHLVGEKWGSLNRRNIFKFLPGNNNSTYNTSGISEFIRFSSYRDIVQSQNYHTKSCSGWKPSLLAELPRKFWRQVAGY